ADKNARVPAVNVIWSQDSKRLALIRRDERKVKDLWVINALSNPRPTLATHIWARERKRLGLLRRDEPKVKDLWVINALSTPRPTLETYRYAMPGEENIAQPEMHIFDIAAKKQVRVKNGRFKDETLSIATAPV